jgi:putative hydrolase of the HAD superfamily
LSHLRPKFIYFDLDDTLLDHKKAEKAGLKDVHDHFEDFFKGVSLSELIAKYHEINSGLWMEYGRGEIDRHILHRRRFEETFVALGLDGAMHEEAGKVYMQYYRNHWEWIEGTKEIFDKIASSYPVGIITNGFAETQWLKIDQFGFKEISNALIVSEEIGVMKPHPKIFDHATELVNVEREEILYVGDSLSSDVRGGKNASWKVAWFTQNPIKEGEELADLVFSDFRELEKTLFDS